jgi:hypothetical protein
VLSLFCDIDDFNIRRLSLRCEKFINKLQTDDSNNDDMDSNDDGDIVYQKEEDDDYGLLSG